MRFRVLVSTVIIAIIGYSLFWFYMAGEFEDRIEAWAQTQKPRGLSLRYKELDITGFPYRMELAFTDLNVIKTNGDGLPVLFMAPNITLIAFPWNIYHGVIVSDGGALRIGRRTNPALTLAFGKSRASVIFDRADGAFLRFSAVLGSMKWVGQNDDLAASTADQMKLHILRPQQDDGHDDMELPVQVKLFMELDGLAVRDYFDKKLDKVRLDLELHGKSLPNYSKDSLTAWRDEGGTLSVKNLEVIADNMNVDLNGELSLDQDMKPLGAFSAKLRTPDQTGDSPPKNKLMQELGRLGNPDSKGPSELAVSLQNGLLYLGPVPVYELAPVVE
ncbi:MAG: DUF2125 domain-containing protein [Emcibacter sp.]|nr:DUF2125 domain-containing protein [Emcibacter sp.]